ncbi:RICIN domain-containing protein [Streptomyces violascens]|uniref:RICIN domain-containing protein n=1 Tax=Streptomyces violascens TaxID=67381 RepID=UPI00167C3934|nr:ricin-type beta-trefoil lectin domain protein [Streptomyces violascens]GGU30313.1 hypothetical protein GCM10010289_59680 [Streptomyces violascens]
MVVAMLSSVALAAFAAVPANAQAAMPPGGSARNAATGFYLNDSSNPGHDDAYAMVGPNPVRWKPAPNTAGTLSANGAYALDAKYGSRAPGTKIISWPAQGTRNQQWQFPGDGTIRIAALTAGQQPMCMSVALADLTVELQPCAPYDPRQQWS